MRYKSLLLALALLVPAPPAVAATLQGLSPGQAWHGWKAVARYRDAGRHAMGARFVHRRTGFTLDLLAIQSVPQAFIWVNSLPTSDKGEPHTQEHLLLGKGKRGGEVATLDSMSLAESTAYTEQWRTCYQFNTSAGPEVFYELLEKRMDALLHPNYADEEVRREVRNFGVKDVPGGGLQLEEKGTVYNEMVSTFERPWNRVYHQMDRAIYGPTHPMSYVAGGSPEALRTLTPADIRTFHDANYRLGNMGMVASLPASMPVERVLKRLDTIFNGLEAHPQGAMGEPRFPAPKAAPAGQVEVLGYPDRNAANPGQLLVAWPARLTFANDQERMLADLFASAFAGDATTNLYKRFIDSKTRQVDLGATSVWAGFDDGLGHPFRVGLSDVAATHLTPAEVARLRDQIQDEIARVAAWPDGAPELRTFNSRVQALVKETRRAFGKFVNSPPGFGFRHTPSTWMEHLDHLARRPGFDKPVTLDADLAAIERLVTGKRNPWRARIAAWKLTADKPYAVAAKPDPTLVERDAAARTERVAAETRRLVANAHAADERAALAQYRLTYDQASAALEKAGAGAKARRFLAHPPLVRDPGLAFRQQTLRRGVPLVASSFDSMTGVMTELDLRLDDVPTDRLVYLSQLPTLLTEVGVIVNGKPVSHEEVSKRLRNEVLGLSAGFSRNPRTHRAELSLSGQGLTGAESERAVAWMRRVALAPDWRVANLPRLRDVVDQAVTSLHGTMRGSEESWVQDPARALVSQDDPLQLATGSFLTREFYAHRLRWLLRDPGTEGAAIAAFLDTLGQVKAPRADLQALTAALAGGPTTSVAPAVLAAFAKLPPTAHAHAVEAAKDLGSYVADLPDGSLAQDWAMLCREMRDDLLVPPAHALAELEAVRQAVFNVRRARVAMVGARAQQASLLARHVEPLLGALADRPITPPRRAAAPLITGRLQQREPGAKATFLGLLNGNTQSGVFLNSVPGTAYGTTDREALLRYLAAKLYSGHGAHGMFMKTWAAGLAYSNGIGGSADAGRFTYYAERCPDLPQTLGFVIGELKRTKPDPALVEYALALAFGDSNEALGYEGRGTAMAADLADGLTPAVVQGFRQRLLTLRADPALTRELFGRMPQVYGKVLPGFAPQGLAPDGTYLVIGPESQFASYERYLRTAVGPDARVNRLYPRDFWALGNP
ncbi:MAG: Zn-dependent peptidase (Insulinase) family [Cyanobacteria bacterium RYN_339]|nr:Zn-dependent peptidase (Insulinase) family [Cyanobacteria bacterium RYN_339]